MAIDPTDYVIADVDPRMGAVIDAGTLATNLASTHVAIETVDAGEGDAQHLYQRFRELGQH